MKNILILFIVALFSSATISAQEINWVSMNEALKLQKKNPKKIMMDVYTLWCGPCKMLDKITFQNPDVVKYVNENFYAVKFNAEGEGDIFYQGQSFKNPQYDPSLSGRNAQHEFASALQIRAFPTIIFFDEESNPIIPLKGYQTPSQLEIYLKLFQADDHKNITSQEQWKKYQEDFKPEFKG